MRFDVARDVFRAERRMRPMPPVSRIDLSDFSFWARDLAASLGCDNAMLTGSVSRQQMHPFSDIDIEMYAKRGPGHQGILRWRDRLVSVHVEPLGEMQDENSDPYYQIWHRSTFKDAKVLFDDSDCIRYLSSKACTEYDVDRYDRALARLAHEGVEFDKNVVTASENGELLEALYHFSYYIQNVAVYRRLEAHATLGSEIQLCQQFVDLTGLDVRSCRDIASCVLTTSAMAPWGVHRAMSTSHEFKKETGPDRIMSFSAMRRILEYRRKLYAAVETENSPVSNLFQLYCLGRILGNFQFLCSDEQSLLIGKFTLSERRIMKLRLTAMLLSDEPMSNIIASDIIVEHVYNRLEQMTV